MDFSMKSERSNLQTGDTLTEDLYVLRLGEKVRRYSFNLNFYSIKAIYNNRRGPQTAVVRGSGPR